MSKLTHRIDLRLDEDLYFCVKDDVTARIHSANAPLIVREILANHYATRLAAKLAAKQKPSSNIPDALPHSKTNDRTKKGQP